MQGVDKYAKAVRENKEIEFDGFVFNPLTVSDYELYYAARPAFELLQSSLPIKLARMSWLPCLWEIDKESGSKLIPLVLCVIGKALRLPETNGGYRIEEIQNGGELKGFFFPDLALFMGIQQMDEVRQIIAAQNDYEIPNENQNPELVEAAQYNARLRSLALKADFEDHVYSVSANCGADYDEIWEWSMRKFLRTSAAVDRKLGFLLCGLTEAQGATYKHGNPYPSWKYDRDNDLPLGFETLASTEAGAKGLLPEAQTQ